MYHNFTCFLLRSSTYSTYFFSPIFPICFLIPCLKSKSTNSSVGVSKSLYRKPGETKQQNLVNDFQGKEQKCLLAVPNQIVIPWSSPEEEVGLLSWSCSLGSEFSQAPFRITAAEITIHFSCWEPTLPCNVLPEPPLSWAERAVGSRVGLDTANVWFRLWQGQYSWSRYSVLICFYLFFFFKGVLRIWRHNPGDFECLIPQIMFWKSSLS